MAVEMALSPNRRQGRFDKAGPHIQALLDRPEPQGSGIRSSLRRIDRSRSLGQCAGSSGRRAQARHPKMPPTRLRSSAVKHLKIAAAQLPDIAEAQARYGVALVLAGEQNLGRQFLQTALRLGSLDRSISALGGVGHPSGRLSRRGRADRRGTVAATSPRAMPRASWKQASTS